MARWCVVAKWSNVDGNHKAVERGDLSRAAAECEAARLTALASTRPGWGCFYAVEVDEAATAAAGPVQPAADDP